MVNKSIVATAECVCREKVPGINLWLCAMCPKLYLAPKALRPIDWFQAVFGMSVARVLEITNSYRVDDTGVIRNPGKFEGQPLWVAVADVSQEEQWTVAYIDDDGDYIDYIILEDEDAAGMEMIGIARDTYALVREGSSQGFIVGDEVSAVLLASWLKDLEIRAADEEESCSCPTCSDDCQGTPAPTIA